MPIMFPPLYRISKEHWNAGILSLVYNVLKVFMDMNSKLFDELTSTYKAAMIAEKKKDKEREDLWRKLDKLDMKQNSSTKKTSAGSGSKKT